MNARGSCAACGGSGQVLVTVYRYYGGSNQPAGTAYQQCQRCGGTGRR